MYAYPSGHNPKTGTQESGMTLRDHFAGEAMKALIPIFDTDPTFSDSNERRMNVALAAYAQAEEMMKARDL
jgi:hypothetical protein